MINAAAIMPFGRLVEEDPRVTNKVMSVNYGARQCCYGGLTPMLERGYGDFISFSSMTGIIPGLLMGAYASSKQRSSTTAKFCITRIATVVYAFVGFVGGRLQVRFGVWQKRPWSPSCPRRARR